MLCVSVLFRSDFSVGGNQPEATLKDWPCHAGPMVRILFPPAESRLRTYLSGYERVVGLAGVDETAPPLANTPKLCTGSPHAWPRRRCPARYACYSGLIPRDGIDPVKHGVVRYNTPKTGGAGAMDLHYTAEELAFPNWNLLIASASAIESYLQQFAPVTA